MRTAVGVSVLFTDLVGSTELAARLGADSADDLRRTHFGLLRAAIAAHRGREVKNLGDGLMVVFPGVGATIDAAIAMQQAIDRHNRSGGELLGVRIGIATGDAEEEDGDVFGEPVVQAARLCARADGGAILAPDVIRVLAPRGAHQFRPVGDLDLKGLPEPVASVEVVWEPAPDASSDAVAIPLQGRLTVPFIASFVGRTPEREVLDSALKRVETGERRAVLIAGEAGMGKTRLVTEVAREAHDHGAVVLYGRCDDELAIPYQPWVEALGHYIEHAAGETLSSHDPQRLADLTRLVPDLYRRLPDLAAPVSTEATTERHLLFAAVTTFLREIAGRQPCVVVLDDLQWADRPTVQLLRQVVGTVDLGAVLVIGTYRDTDLDADHPMTEALATLHREPGVDLLPLTGLDDVEVIALLEAIAGHELPDAGIALAHAVRGETEGNPFFVGEVLRHLAETGAIAQQDDGRWVAATDLAGVGLPASVRAVVGQRVHRLGEAVHQMLATAAVVGREFDLEVIVAAARLDEDEVLDALDAATVAGLVAEVPGAPDRFTFTHALVRHTLYDEQAGSRRVRLHHRVAEALEAMLGDDPGDRIGELANHWLAATRPADLDKAVEYARRAGDRARAALAPDEAVRWYRLALDALEHRPDPDGRLRCELLIALGQAEEAISSANGRDHLVEAAALAEHRGALDLLVEALLSRSGAVLGELDEEVVAHLEMALDRVGPDDGPQRAMLLASLAAEFTWHRPDETIRLADEAIAVGRRSGDRAALLTVIKRSAFAWLTPDRMRQGRAVAAEGLELAIAADDPVAIADLALLQFTMALGAGEIEDVGASLDLLCEAAGRTATAGLWWWTATCRSVWTLLAGDADEAEQQAARALEILSGPSQWSIYGAQLFATRWHQGRLGELTELAEKVAADNPGVPSFRTVVPWAQAHAGRLDRAAGLLGELRAERFELPWNASWVTGTMLLGETAHLVGDQVAASETYDRLAPWSDLVSCTQVTCEGPVAHMLGLLAETLGRHDDAVGHQEAALALARRLDAPFHIGRAELALGRLRSDRGLVTDALAIARRHGYAAVEASAADALVAIA